MDLKEQSRESRARSFAEAAHADHPATMTGGLEFVGRADRSHQVEAAIT